MLTLPSAAEVRGANEFVVLEWRTLHLVAVELVLHDHLVTLVDLPQ